MGKGENAGNQRVFLFPVFYSSQNKFQTTVVFVSLSSNALNFDWFIYLFIFLSFDKNKSQKLPPCLRLHVGVQDLS